MDNSKIFSNMIWRFAERCGAQIVTFIVSIILARLLTPEDYGTIALVTVFTTILNVFVDSGLGTSLVQKKDTDDIDFSTVFYTNICICIVLYCGMFLASPIISNFYDKPDLVPIVRVLSLTLIISGVKNIQQAYVSKNMMFKRFFFATLGGTLGAAILGITMAYLGFGVWALVAQQLFNSTVDTIILWITVKWRPINKFSFKRLKTLFGYGWKLLISALLDTSYNELRQLIVGKLYSSSDLAYYNKGDQFPRLIITNINTSIDSVLLPSMSSVQDNKEKIRNMTRRSIKTSVFIMAPLMLGLVAISDKVVLLLLTEKWLPCVPFLCVFCITYIFYPIHTANLNAIKAMGRSDLFLKLEIIKKIVGIIAILITMNISVWAMCLSLLVTSVLCQIINAWPNNKLLNYNFFEQLKDIFPSIGMAMIMFTSVTAINLINIPILISAVLQILIGGIIYILLAKLLKIETFNYLANVITPYINRFIKKI